MQYQISEITANLNFWSALGGLIGAILIFLFGLPPKIDPEGHQHLLLEGVDENERRKAKTYKKISYFGVFLLIISFLLQVIISIK